ncbi:tRNA (adenosine(37)-N6)-dimethylallyltransferase MiaA [Noviherbaspirillum massiliense]|uniref:tRNA (adenosine(37)-N6)-dimethylallyltransferase MiaA n=1 Tax=Noviherbaspirillum massiliense TaxID=1465823 RepID=UPI0002D9ED78|nr:tRNA (adenosine(37)-N6)-dimethylallyltransferase MiaA [Noviherbaspirillum massiliense]
MSAQKKPVAIALMGPTASGKTAAALEIARHLPVEIISVDSALVYRGMDVGTAKPSLEERAAAPHHLIDILDPTEAYSVMQFREDALRLVSEISARGKLPLLVGGTMLYFKALQEGLDALPPADPDIRRQLDEEAAAVGMPAMHAKLATIDPETAARLKPNDSQRIQRALEIFALTGQPMSELLAKAPKAELPFDLVSISLEPSDRSVLHARIAQRFDAMLDPVTGGLLDEVQALRARGDLHLGLPSMRCVGYRQAWEYLDGAYDRTALREKGIAATRQLAKRQLTWLRSMPGRLMVDCTGNDPVRDVMAALNKASGGL